MPANLPAHATPDALRALDESGAFAATRAWFEIPDGLLYLDGNSLGPPVRSALGAVRETLDEHWARGLVRSWEGAGWWAKPVELGELLAPLLGAAPGQVVVCDSISVNLFKVLTAAARMRPHQRVLVVEEGAFPTDRYLASSVSELLDLELRVVAGPHELSAALRGAGVALLGHVDYRTAYRHDLAEVSELVRQSGALLVADLAHSAGAMPIELDAAGVDFAVGCTYKYLNGGPGAPGFVYAASRHVPEVHQPIAGWHGDADPFAMRPVHEPDPGIRRFLAGSPPIVAYAALEASLRLLGGVDLAEIERLSRSLATLLESTLATACPGLELASPRDPSRRGSHLAYRHRDPHALARALAKRSVIADAREPDLLRLALTPLYLGHREVHEAGLRIAGAVGELG